MRSRERKSCSFNSDTSVEQVTTGDYVHAEINKLSKPHETSIIMLSSKDKKGSVIEIPCRLAVTWESRALTQAAKLKVNVMLL